MVEAIYEQSARPGWLCKRDKQLQGVTDEQFDEAKITEVLYRM